jgi:ABC-type dipeptide/oligopeptide/nickel transport system ATPase component
VGESGSGKSLTALSAMGLLPPGARVDDGRILLREGAEERDLLRMAPRELRRARGRSVAMIFQEPQASLNPVLPIGEQVGEALRLHAGLRSRALRDETVRLLERVGMRDGARRLGSYPHELSGGLRQRVVIAMALAGRPRVLLADEPTTALDVTLQAQALDLLDDLQRETGMAIVLISHALNVVGSRSDAVSVMFGGRVVEHASSADLFARPLHPYTRALMASAPDLRERRDRLASVDDAVADPAAFDLRTVARSAGMDEALAPQARELRLWWPSHAPPERLRLRARACDDYALIEAAPGRWLGVWRSPEAGEMVETPPRTEWRRPSSAGRAEPGRASTAVG